MGGSDDLWPWLFTYATNIYTWHTLLPVCHGAAFLDVGDQGAVLLGLAMGNAVLATKWLVPFLLTLCCLGPVWRLCASFHNSPHDWSAAYTFTPGIVDFLAIGAVLAIASDAHQSSEETLQRSLRIRGIANRRCHIRKFILGVTLGRSSCSPRAGDTGAALVFCWLIGAASRGFVGTTGRLLEWRPIVYLGKISYGIYIYHFLVPLAFTEAARRY